MRLGWVLCLVMAHLPMDTRVSGEPGTQRRGEKYVLQISWILASWIKLGWFVVRTSWAIFGNDNFFHVTLKPCGKDVANQVLKKKSTKKPLDRNVRHLFNHNHKSWKSVSG